MENTFNYKLLINQLKLLDITLPLPNIIEEPYKWLNSNFKETGALFDKYVKSALDHQYHIPWYILSSSILQLYTDDNQYKLNRQKSLKYLINLGYKTNQNANSFIGIPLILSMIFIKDENIKNQIRKYINGIEFIPSHGSQNANNFHCLKMTALLLKEKILHINLDSKELKFIKNIAYKKLPEWQYDDGIFYDKPYNSNEFKGVPHLTYHATIIMCTILSSILLEDKNIFKMGERGMIALEHLVSPAGEAGSYGRSNNAIFGYSSAIFAISLYQVFANNNNINTLRNILLKHLDDNLCKDGHIYIVPNKFENYRVGFDKYMFVTVYESWTLGLLILSHLLKPLVIND